MSADRKTRRLAFAVAAALVVCAPGVAVAAAQPYPGDLGQAVAALVIFLVLLAILGRYAWGPIVAQLRRRDDDFQAKVEDAEKSQADADEIVTEYTQRMETVDEEAAGILDQAKRQAEIQTQELLDGARAEARQTVIRAEEDISVAADRTRRELQASTARMAAEIAGQILRKELTEQEHRRLVNEAAEQIARSTRATEDSQ
jgi:F-type H+-transporting ATPase subunit b